MEEEEEKGICIGIIDKCGKAYHEFIPLPVRNMLTMEINIENDENPTDEFVSAIKEYNIKDAIVRVSYEASEEQNSKIDFREIENALKEAFLVAGISRNIQKKSIIRRSILSEEMELFSALKEYIKLQNWHKWENDLNFSAKKLEQEIFQSGNFQGEGEK